MRLAGAIAGAIGAAEFARVVEAVLRNGFSPRIEFLARPIEFLNWPDALETPLRVALYVRPSTPLEGVGAAEFAGIAIVGIPEFICTFGVGD